MDLGQLLADAIVRTHGENAAKWIKPDVDGGLTLDGKFDLKQIAEMRSNCIISPTTQTISDSPFLRYQGGIFDFQKSTSQHATMQRHDIDRVW